MSSGRGSTKRKFQYNGEIRGSSKRFHHYTSSKPEFKRNAGSSRWKGRISSHSRYPNPHRSSQYTAHNDRPNPNTSNKTNHNHVYNQLFDYPQYNQTQHSREQIETITGPGSEFERMEKVLATKKRLEEALASKPLHSIDQDIAFKDPIEELNKDKNLDTNVAVGSSELRLTNSDFKEIGSVASGVGNEKENESNDIVLNITPCSQQRSFDNSCSSTSLPPTSKVQRPGGWSFSELNENNTTQIKKLPPARVRGEKFIKDNRETILGNVVIPNVDGMLNQAAAPKSSNLRPEPKQTRHDFSSIGHLYHSFLRSRLSGYTLKMSDVPLKNTGPNPLLDKSVLGINESANNVEYNTVLELQMPSPIQVKAELNDLDNGNTSSSSNATAIEGNEFCKRYGFLLKDPNFLIPPEDLKKLGLGHLCEMNKLVKNTRSQQESITLKENQNIPLRVKPILLNSVAENDRPNEPSSTLISNANVLSEERNKSLGHHILNSQDHSNSPTLQNANHYSAQASRVHGFLNQSPSILVHNEPVQELNLLSKHQNLVENVVEKVVQKIFQSSEVKSQVPNTENSPVLTNREKNLLSSTTNQNEPPDLRRASSVNDVGASKLNINNMQDISSRVLRLFLIDKQIEDLMQEKMKIYSELLSEKEISSTLFNSWAQDQIQQGNVLKVLSDPSNAVPQLTSFLSNAVGLTPNVESNPALFKNCVFSQSVSELFTLKKEEILEHSSMEIQNCETYSGNNISINDSFTQLTADPISPEPERPKLSVRKDLLDPEINVELLIKTDNAFINSAEVTDPPKVTEPPEVTGPPEVTETPEVTGSPEVTEPQKSTEPPEITEPSEVTEPPEVIDPVFKNNVNIKNEVVYIDENISKDQVKHKKKKKSKKGNPIECISLLDDSSDDEVYSIDNEASEEVSCTDDQQVVENETKSKKSKDKNNVNFVLDNNVATCLTVLKRALIVGTKEGNLIVFNTDSGKTIAQSQIHKQSVVYINTSLRNVVTASTDSTISLYSLQTQSKIQTIQVSSPVQCCEIQFNRLFVGTKTGILATYKMETSPEENGKPALTSLSLAQKPLKLTLSSILDVKAAKEGARIVLIIASRGEQVTVRDASSGLLLRAFDWCDTVYCLQLFEQLPIVYCGTNTKSVKVVNYMNGESTHNCSLGRSVIQMLFLSSVLFAACHDGKIYAYDVKMKTIISVMSVSKGLILSIALLKKKLIVANNRSQLQVIPFPVELKEHLKKQYLNKDTNL